MTVDLPEPDGPNTTVSPGEGALKAMSIAVSAKR